MKRIIGLLVTLIVCVVPRAIGQNFEDEFNAFVKQNEQAFIHFTDSINRQFAEAMEKNMRSFPVFQPEVRDPKPRPEKLPEAENNGVPQKPPMIPKPEQTRDQKSDNESKQSSLQPSASSKESITTPSELLNRTEFELFGEDVRYVKKTFPENMIGITPEDVSSFWIQLSESEYEPLLEVCRIARTDRGFNDWAIYQFVLEIARQTYPNLYNEQVVMTVFLLNQLGMEAKVGFGDTHLFCLLAVKQQIYGIPFTKIAAFSFK